ncbi:MAG: homoserine kinase [Polyangiaceae bacterium]|nr:homoserine kinase [Polyangiaceae bacterium]MCE7891234.1 homoserine kinase [Sorangiineae bacterium PRO1]MCL4754157.1 homoserine kinase [Myxococcales bacterium]
MARLTPLELEEARRIGRSFGLEVRQVEALSGGSVNSNFRVETASAQSVFLRVYEEQVEAGARRELALLATLARAGVPTPEPLSQRLEQHRGKPVALFPWIEGEILCQARVRPEHTRAVGAALARVHLVKVDELAPSRFELGDLQARLERARTPEYAEDVERIAERLVRYAQKRDPSLPSGVIHGDLFRDNVLWRGGQLAALIDFESASLGVFAFDLMVCVQAWCFGDRFDLELVRSMLEGYHAVRRLEPRELAALGVEAALGALRFATTRITDYSLRAPPGQPPLRDYRRFLARLAEIEAGVLEPVALSLG